MNVHEFGKGNQEIIVLIHPSIVMWDYFEYVIPLMEEQFHLIIPALPGYDPDCPGDFTSVEKIAAEIAAWLISHGITEISCIYGCSMGGSIVTRFLADNRVKARSAVIDGGITPYQLPWIVTRLIAIRDFLMISIGKIGRLKLLEKAFSTDDYSEEDLKYAAKVMKMISPKTIWRTFDSCNNYRMPDEIRTDCRNIEYWYAEAEEKSRKWDMDYFRTHFPQTFFRKFENIGHGGLAVLQPERLAEEISRVVRSADPEKEGESR